MIRRTPTLIPMGDSDVQDVRDLVAKQKADALAHQQLMLKMKRIADNPNVQQEDLEMIEQIRIVNARHEKAKRIGIEPESSKSS